MTICSNLRFKWRVRRTILAVQSAGYVTLPMEDGTVIGYLWSDPWNSVTVQVSRSDDQLGHVTRTTDRDGRVSRSNVRLGQVTCSVSRESDDCPARSWSLAGQRDRGIVIDTTTRWTHVQTYATVDELRAIALNHASRARLD